ncbi:YdcF family protein [Microbacterium schleiferi]|uniref:YdcF family protein n=1 Tax=Microbacterium schleiferi TaxID=69362 RepID=UPI00311D3C42
MAHYTVAHQSTSTPWSPHDETEDARVDDESIITRARWARRAGLGILAIIALVAVIGLPLYVFPADPPAPNADLIYVIGPPTATRIADAESLRDQGIADQVLVSVPPSGPDSAGELAYCWRAYVTCRTPNPFTTRGEAAMLQAYASDGDTVIVLTYTPHVLRTRYIFDTCADADVTVIPVDERLNLSRWIYNYAYQSAAFAKAWILGCADPPADALP